MKGSRWGDEKPGNEYNTVTAFGKLNDFDYVASVKDL